MSNNNSENASQSSAISSNLLSADDLIRRKQKSTFDLDKIFDFQNDCVNLSIIRKKANMGLLRNSPFRSLFWMILLEVVPPNKLSDWESKLKAKRVLYNQHISVKNKKIKEYYQEMRVIIDQDIARTHPNLNFFKNENIKTCMKNILLAYSIRQSSGYRQGMHEILAILIFTFHHHQTTHSHALENERLSDNIKNVLSLFYADDIIEADLYFTFNAIMSVIYDWYIVKEDYNEKGEKLQYCPGVRYIEEIFNEHLPLYSKELYKYMVSLNITPITFGLKWIRLFFAQEFPFSDLFYIWDAIFAQYEHSTFPLVRYIFISLLLSLKEAIIGKDFADALCLLMRVPQEFDIAGLINLSLHLYKPSLHHKSDISSIISKSFLSAQKPRAESKTINRSKSFKGFQSLFSYGSRPENPYTSSTPPTTINRRPSLAQPTSFVSSFMDFFQPSGRTSPTNNENDATLKSRTINEVVSIDRAKFIEAIEDLKEHLDKLKQFQTLQRKLDQQDPSNDLNVDFKRDSVRIKRIIVDFEAALNAS